MKGLKIALDCANGASYKSGPELLKSLGAKVYDIGVSPNGFNAYFLFKVLILAYTGLIMIHALAFFYRSFLEWQEGEDSEGKYLDMDIRTSEEAGK